MGRSSGGKKSRACSKKTPQPLVSEILVEIATDIAELAERVAYRGIPYEQVATIERGKEHRRRLQALRDLETRKLIVVHSIAGNMLIGLTRQGRMRSLRDQIRWCRTTLPKNECCLVTFDIPAIADNARRSFLRFLKQCRFKRLQLSVYSTTNEVFDLLVEFVRRSKIERWVTVLHVKRQM